MAGLKKCGDCQSVLLIEDFYKLGRNKDGFETICKTCRRLKNKAWYESNKQAHARSIRPSSIYRRFGISEAEYDEFFIKQPFCGICKKDYDLCLDHDHNSKEIRGVLCRQCNSALGLFKDNVNILKGAVQYLESTN